MFYKLLNKKYYVPNIVKRNLIKISNALKNDIEYLFQIITNKYFHKNMLKESYMRHYDNRFKLRLIEFENIMLQFVHYPSFYGILSRYTELLNKADEQKFCDRRDNIDLSLAIQINRHFDLIKNQLFYIS